MATKNEMVRGLAQQGVTKAAEIVARLAAQGVTLDIGYVHTILSGMRKEGVLPPSDRSRQVQVTPVQTTPVTPVQHHSVLPVNKSDAIRQMIDGGIIEPAKIKQALAEQGIDVGMNLVYSVLSKQRAANKGKGPGVAKVRHVEAVPSLNKAPISPAEVDVDLTQAVRLLASKFNLDTIQNAVNTVRAEQTRAVNIGQALHDLFSGRRTA